MGRVAIAFGWGRESFIMLGKYRKFKPILITCLGEKDIDPRCSEILHKATGLRVITLRGESYNENWSFREGGSNCNIVSVESYSNTILKHFKKRKPFDVLVVGRRRKDLIERDVYKFPPDEVKVKGVEFPLWGK
jgi:hypothetical protein